MVTGFAFCAGLYLWLCEVLKNQFPAMIGSLVPVVGSYFFFWNWRGVFGCHVAIPLPLGLWGLWRISNNWFQVLFVAFCMAWMSIENPYLAPVLPVVAVVRWFQGKNRTKIFCSLLGGSLAILSVALFLKAGANPEYPREVAGKMVSLFGLKWKSLIYLGLEWDSPICFGLSLFDGPHRLKMRLMHKEDIFRYFFIGLFSAFYLVCTWEKAQYVNLHFLDMAACRLSAFLGFSFHGLAGPFLFYNTLMDTIARPLTQPTRYLIICVIGFSLLVAVMAQRYPKWSYWFVVGILMESLLWGGLHLNLPETKLPQYSCSTEIDGPVLLWPWDAIDGEMSRSQLYQMVHKQASPHTGIASWALSKKVV